MDVQDCALAHFTLGFFDGVAYADFEAITIGGDGFSVFQFHGDLAGENGADCTVLVKNLEGISFDFNYTCYRIDTIVSLATI